MRKFIWKYKAPQIARGILNTKLQASQCQIKMYYIAVFKTAWSWHRNRHAGQQNRIVSKKLTHISTVNQYLTKKLKSLQV